MIVERLEATGKPDKLRVCFAGGEPLVVSSGLVVQFSLFAGANVEPERMIALKAAAAMELARERAVRILAASAVSEHELQKRLVQKGTPEQDAAESVSWLKEHGFLDDARTAAQLVDSAVRRGYGRARIKSILYEKGIPRELWDEALERIPEMDEAIDRFVAQRLRGRGADEKTVKKTIDALLRRGFTYGQARDALRRYAAEIELEEVTEDME